MVQTFISHLSDVSSVLPRLAAVILPPRVLSGSNRVELPTGGVELLKKILIETDFK